MNTSNVSIHALRLRVLQLGDAHRGPLLAAFERAAEMPAGPGRDDALARVSKRLLRAEALSARQLMTR